MRARLDIDLSRFRRNRPPVLLLGGLNLLRPLGMAGIPAIVAASDRWSPAFLSRYCSGRCLLPPLGEREAVLDVLMELGQRLGVALGGPVPLFYGNDDTLALVQQCRGVLEQRFRLLLNDPPIADALVSKDGFERLARSRGLPVPRALAWEGAGEGALAGAAGPVLVKPRTKLDWHQSPVHLRLFDGAGKARIFANGRDVLSNALVRELRDQLLFQEYVAGDDRHLWSFHGFADEHAAPLAWFIGRKIRTYPASTGESTYLQLSHNAQLYELGMRIVERVPLKGVFKIDLKQDERTAQWHLLEINPRFNLWHYMGARNGVNLPAVAYAYLTSGYRPACQPRHGTAVRWVYLRLDALAYRDLSARGRLNALGWLASLALSRKVCELFSWTDPAPFLGRLEERLVLRLQRLARRFASGVARWRSTA